jgi:hypothetical protein
VAFRSGPQTPAAITSLLSTIQQTTPRSGPFRVAHVNLTKIRCNTKWFDAFWESPDDNAFYLTKYPI